MWLHRLGLLILAAAIARAGDIEGHVVITQRITKKKVSVSSPYERGISVKTPPATGKDSFEFEWSRVAVYLEGDLGTEPGNAVMQQKERLFLPDTLVVAAGSRVSFPNLDAIFHNVFSLSKPQTFDLGNYPKDHTRTVTFSKPGIVFVNCHLHPNMTAAIVVTPNRWSTKPDGNGQFLLRDVPPGKYNITAWHRAAGFFRETVTVTAGRPAAVTFTIPLPADGPVQTTARR